MEYLLILSPIIIPFGILICCFIGQYFDSRIESESNVNWDAIYDSCKGDQKKYCAIVDSIYKNES